MIPDFSEVRTLAEAQAIFVRAARSIMLDYRLKFGPREWDITALELYLYAPHWKDPTAHCSSTQLEKGRWYVHCTKRGNLRAAQYTGLDITAGSTNPETGEKTYAGMLIREIDQIDGPALALQTIVRGEYDGKRRGWADQEQKLLGGIHDKSVFNSPLMLARRSEAKHGQLWIGPRWLRTNNPKMKDYKNLDLRVATWRTRKRFDKMRLVEDR